MKNNLLSTRNFNNDLALLIFRITLGGLMLLLHGIPKIDRMSQAPVKFMDFMGLGPEVSLGLVLFAEVLCSVLIITGTATRLALIPLIITMLVAIFQANAGKPLKDIELPVIYLAGFIALFISGSGKYSVDSLISKNSSRS